MQKQGWFQYIDELMVFSIDGAALEFSALFGIRRFFFVLLFFVRTEFDLRAYVGVPVLGTPWILCLIITMARIMITNANPIKLCTEIKIL